MKNIRRSAAFMAIAGLTTALASMSFATGGASVGFAPDPGGVAIDFFDRSTAVKSVGEQIEKIKSRGVAMILYPAAYTDNLCCVSSGDVGQMMFWFINDVEASVENPRVMLELPEAIRLMDITTGARIVNQKTVQGKDGPLVQYELDIADYKNAITKVMNTWRGLWCIIQTELPAGDTLYHGRYWYVDGTYQTEPLAFGLKVIPAVQGAAPSTFRTAAVFGMDSKFDNDRAVQAYTAFYKRVGFNSVHFSGPGKFTANLSQAGIKRYLQPSLLVNGYMLGGEGKPESVRFKFMDGTYDDRGICPVEVYHEGSYFKKEIEGMLHRILVTNRQTEMIMPNWEPYTYEYRGCYCSRCKEEFVAFSKLDKQTVEGIWPRQLQKKAYSGTWIRFRSWQHARLVETLEKTVQKLGEEAGIESHFIPEVQWDNLTPLVEQGDGCKQYLPIDYAQKLPILEPWGPYIWYEMMGAPEYYTGAHALVWAAAKVTREYLVAQIKDPSKRPQLIAFPHGHQLKGWITTPEEIEMDCLTFFLNRWDGAFVYYFPRGYDARYWTALARVNSRVAELEPYIFQGTEIRKHHLDVLTPLPEPHISESSEDSRVDVRKLLSNMAIVQSIEYQQDGRRLIAVANFWQKGDCFIRLKVEGVDAHTRYVLWEPTEKRSYSNAKGERAWSAQELAQGVVLHVGALRFGLFILEPQQANGDYGSLVNPQDMAAAMRQRLPVIQKAFEWERQHQSQGIMVGSAASPVEYQLESLKKGGLRCESVRVEALNRVCLAFSSPLQRIVVDPVGGGRIMSWKVKDAELVHQDHQAGLLLDGFWFPGESASPITQPYEVVVQEVTENGLMVTLARKLQKEVKGLEGLTVRKTFLIPAQGTGFTISTEVENTTSTEKEFAFRYQSMPSCLEQGEGEGAVVMESKAGKVEFNRDLICKMYRLAAPADPQIDNAFEIKKISAINSPEVRLEASWLPVKVVVRFEKDQLYSIVYWDSGAQACATFEPIFSRVRIRPRAIWKTQTEWLTE